MAVIAWHPVCLYRLSLGRQDKLQGAVLALREQSTLPPSADEGAVRWFLSNSASAKASLAEFSRYVPTRFLAPWFANKLRGQKDSTRGRLITELARQSQQGASACPYWLEGDRVCVNEVWGSFLRDNMGVVRAFAEHHLAIYLQTRNPNVPGVVNKLRAPTKRQFTIARDFWRLVQETMMQEGRPQHFQDIYSQRPLARSFAIDHFLPWSFVVHDLLWNLTPVEKTTNSRKNDSLPDLEVYLPRLVGLHFQAIRAVRIRPSLLEDYTECFRLDTQGLLALRVEELMQKYHAIMAPQTQIAMNQGFPAGWAYNDQGHDDVRFWPD